MSYVNPKVATYGILWCILEATLIFDPQSPIDLTPTELLCRFCNHCWIKVTVFTWIIFIPTQHCKLTD